VGGPAAPRLAGGMPARRGPATTSVCLNYVATTWKANQEAYKSDYNIILMTEYKDLATMEASEPKADALAQKVEGDDTKQMQGYKERAEIREIVGDRLAREIVLEPRP
jgi:hypothetical protein